jgi:hypothetical protein
MRKALERAQALERVPPQVARERVVPPPERQEPA